MALTTTQTKALIRASAESQNVNVRIALAIAETESGYNAMAMRYEPKWKYLVSEQSFASALKITVETERQLQKFSYGLFQIMGSVARELGFSDMLPELLDPYVNIKVGLHKIKQLADRLKDIEAYVSAYNAGIGGVGTNPEYVKKVLKAAEKY